jgi:hypothetical protein
MYHFGFVLGLLFSELSSCLSFCCPDVLLDDCSWGVSPISFLFCLIHTLSLFLPDPGGSCQRAWGLASNCPPPPSPSRSQHILYISFPYSFLSLVFRRIPGTLYAPVDPCLVIRPHHLDDQSLLSCPVPTPGLSISLSSHLYVPRQPVNVNLFPCTCHTLYQSINHYTSFWQIIIVIIIRPFLLFSFSVLFHSALSFLPCFAEVRLGSILLCFYLSRKLAVPRAGPWGCFFFPGCLSLN